MTRGARERSRGCRGEGPRRRKLRPGSRRSRGYYYESRAKPGLGLGLLALRLPPLRGLLLRLLLPGPRVLHRNASFRCLCSHTRSHPRGPGERRPRDIRIEISNKVQGVREEGLIDVEGLAGVSHSPERRGGVRGRRRSSIAPPRPRPLGAEFGTVRVRVRRPRVFTGIFSFTLTVFLLFSLLDCRAELGRLVGC